MNQEQKPDYNSLVFSSGEKEKSFCSKGTSLRMMRNSKRGLRETCRLGSKKMEIQYPEIFPWQPSD